MKLLLKLFITFFKIGIMTFGGGIAMLPMLQREVVEKNKWATEDELIDYFAIGQCTPGIIAVNTATFIGYRKKGVIGGIFSTLGVITPSIIVITAIAALISNFSDNEIVLHAFAGIRVAVCALIFAAIVKLIKNNFKKTDEYRLHIAIQIILAVTAFVVVAVLGRSPVWVVVGASAAGLVLGKWGAGK
ncbi:MAG: chromate transporter [Clostridiales bacterium]|nr:chromate transporter [Clostridiales bacterium]